ncbi:MAG: HAD-IB family phosphatase [Gammaproteobacteria bacterium]
MSYGIICFDCDSTLSKIEGIDELAGRAGLREEMSILTEAAMNGEVPLEAVYEKRLTLIRPNADSIDWLAGLYVAEVVEGALDVCAALMAHGKEVHIVSGGLRQAILPLADYLRIPEGHVHAVDIYFNADGSYRNYDQTNPLARTGGKTQICRDLKRPEHPLVMIGDGKTDMEAKQDGVSVIGFGGVAARPVVRELADHFVEGPSLAAVLRHIL